MFASHMILVSQTSTSPQLISATAATSTALLRSHRVTRRSHNHQQNRAFRFGLWASHLDPNFQRVIEKRHKIIKHKYAEAMHRRLSWDRQYPYPIKSSRLGFKSFMCSAFSAGKDMRPSGRWMNMDAFPPAVPEDSAKRGIEDVEQSALDHLFERNGIQPHSLWNWGTEETASAMPKRANAENRAELKSMQKNMRRAAAKGEEFEYVFDPISNRKVLKKVTKESAAAKQAANKSDMPPPEIQNITQLRNRLEEFASDQKSFSDFARARLSARGTQQFGTIHLDGPPTRAELRKYKPYKHNEPDGKAPGQSVQEIRDGVDAPPTAKELRAYKSYLHNEPDGKAPEATDISDFDKPPTKEELKKYRPYRHQEPDGKAPEEPVTEGDYDQPPTVEELRKYRPYRHNEPDGNAPESTEISEYDQPPTAEELKKYRPYRHNEPDGKAPEVATDVSDFDQPPTAEELAKYRAYRYNEPDGKAPEPPLPASAGDRDFDMPPTAEELSRYKAYRHSEPDGMYKKAGEQIPVDEGLAEYDNKVGSEGPGGYPAFRHSEPDGMYKEAEERASPDEGLAEYDERANGGYPAFRHSEPDGMYKEAEQQIVADEGLAEYDQGSQGGYPAFRHSEPDGKYKVAENQAAVNDGHQDYDRRDASSSSWLSKEGFATIFGFRGQSGSPGGDGSRSNGSGKSAGKLNSILGTKKPSTVEAEQSKVAKIRSVLDRAADSDKREDLDLLRPSDVRAASGIIRSLRKETEQERAGIRDSLEADFKAVNASSAEVLEATSSIRARKHLAEKLRIEVSELMNLNAHARGTVNAKIAELQAASTSAQSSGAENSEKKLTGNFVRDFPEEFTTTWTTASATTGDALVPKASTATYENEVQNAENEYAASQESSSVSAKPSRLQTALDRNQGKLQDRSGPAALTDRYDPYSKKPQGLEVSYKHECAAIGDPEPAIYKSSYGCENVAKASPLGNSAEKQSEMQQEKDLVKEVRSIYESKYGTINTKHRQVNTKESAAAASVLTPVTSAVEQVQEPTQYRILAYDPTMQEINTASTTSIVPDTEPALTPAEVLLRLSNPAKFFPHFAPLQQQGFEIVSGSGDVLVFRKVRADTTTLPPPAKLFMQGKEVERIGGFLGAKGIRQSPTPAPANFASPTGFVNHDIPFKSNIDVRREEPVFSGSKSSSWQGKEQGQETGKKGSTGKRLLIGAGWVAACSYAVGVTMEFFRTGGTEGAGVVGLGGSEKR